MCQTMLLKAKTNGQDDQGGFQDGQEVKDGYLEGKKGHQNSHLSMDGHHPKYMLPFIFKICRAIWNIVNKLKEIKLSLFEE